MFSLNADNVCAPNIEVLNSSICNNNQLDNNDDNCMDIADTIEETSDYKHTDSSLLGLENDQKSNENNIRLPAAIRYGFQNRHANFFAAWQGQVREIIALPSPDTTTPSERTRLRIADEDTSFDGDRFLGDALGSAEDPLFLEAISFVPHWKKVQKEREEWSSKVSTSFKEFTIAPLTDIPENGQSLDGMVRKLNCLSINNSESSSSENSEGTSKSSDFPQVLFTEKEQETLRNLPNREYLVEEDQSAAKSLLYGVVDILIGYAYDHRMTCGDSTVESAWTISILSPTLSWLDTSAPDMSSVVTTAFRRVCSYPYLRSPGIAHVVLQDVIQILILGKRSILRCLLQTFRIFERSETHYLLCKLYLEDYCVWIQNLSSSQFDVLAQEMQHAVEHWDMDQTGWKLEELVASMEGMEEESSSEDMTCWTDSEDDDSSSECSSSSEDD